MYLVDYHTHSIHSPDGFCEIDAMCVFAIEKGVKELVISDHFDPISFDLECISHYPYPVDKIEREIMAAKEKYQSKLKLLYGVEAAQSQIYPEAVQKLLDAHSFDFVLGSVHELTGDINLERYDYRGKETEILRQYYLELLKLAKIGKYDCLAHLEYPKRYCLAAGMPYDVKDYWEIIEQILKTVIQTGKGIELNTSGIRKYSGGILPCEEIIGLYRQLGGEIVTLGSDSHTAAEIGANIKEAAALLQKSGFRFFTVYENRQPAFISIK